MTNPLQAGVDHAELRRLAEAAGDGTWQVGDDLESVEWAEAPGIPLANADPESMLPTDLAQILAAYIAAANPAVMVALLNEIDALRAAPVLPDRGWRDIESAPNNTDHMRPILLFWKHAGVGLGWYDVDDDFQERPTSWRCPETGWRCEGDQCIPMNQEDCTHWMPLPDAPAEGAE